MREREREGERMQGKRKKALGSRMPTKCVFLSNLKFFSSLSVLKRKFLKQNRKIYTTQFEWGEVKRKREEERRRGREREVRKKERKVCRIFDIYTLV